MCVSCSLKNKRKKQTNPRRSPQTDQPPVAFVLSSVTLLFMGMISNFTFVSKVCCAARFSLASASYLCSLDSCVLDPSSLKSLLCTLKV